METSENYYSERVKVSSDSIQLLGMAAEYWSDRGPGVPPTWLATAMKYSSQDQAIVEISRIREELKRGNSLPTRADIIRCTFLAEIGFVSVIVGPSDWYNSYGYAEDEMLRKLRELQDEIEDLGLLVGQDALENLQIAT